MNILTFLLKKSNRTDRFWSDRHFAENFKQWTTDPLPESIQLFFSSFIQIYQVSIDCVVWVFITPVNWVGGEHYRIYNSRTHHTRWYMWRLNAICWQNDKISKFNLVVCVCALLLFFHTSSFVWHAFFCSNNTGFVMEFNLFTHSTIQHCNKSKMCTFEVHKMTFAAVAKSNSTKIYTIYERAVDFVFCNEYKE